MLEYSPYAYESHENPYPIYKRLRAEAPVYWNPQIGFWALSRHKDVLMGFRSPELFSNRMGVSLEPSASNIKAEDMMSFLGMDPPRHTRMRALVSRGFTPRRIADMEPRIREIAVGHIGSFIDKGRCDFIRDFAGKFPMDVISELLGVPEPDRDELRSWADTVVHREDGVLDVPQAGLEAAIRMIGYFNKHIEAHQRQPSDDLTSALLEAEIDGDRLEPREVLAFLFLMIIAGNETTTKLLGNAMHWVSKNPEQRALVTENHELIPRWVEETLRYDPSTQGLARVAMQDIELEGQKIRKDDRVFLLIGSANRDETIWDDPDRFDIMRSTNASLAFGQGTHFCLGASLARLEGRIALEEVMARFPKFEIEHERSVRVHSINVRGFAEMPMEFSR